MDFSKNKDIFKSDTYKGYEINSNYFMSRKNLKKIINTLEYCKDNIDRPLASRYVLDLDNNHSFDISKLTRKIKSYFKNNYGFIYSFEYAERKGLHLEIMLIFDQSKYSPESVYSMLKKMCFNLDGVAIRQEEYNGVVRDVLGLGYLPVKNNVKDRYLETGNRAGHNLKDPIHFKACVKRASYLAKQDDKENVQYKKKFNTNIG